jgi:hypothetical protein
MIHRDADHALPRVTETTTSRHSLRRLNCVVYLEWKVPYFVAARSSKPCAVPANGPPLTDWITLDALRIG